MSPDVVTVDQETSVVKISQILKENNIRHLPVTDGGKLVGMPTKIRPDQSIELAAVKMLEKRVTGIPVVTAKGEIVGILTQGDVFKVLIAITGIYQGGVQFAFNLEDRAGSIKEVADVIRKYQGTIVSILSMSDIADEGYRHVLIRIKEIPEEDLQEMTKEMEQNFMLLSVTKDPLKEI